MDQKQAHKLGTYLRSQRERQGLSTRHLAEAAGVNQATVVRIEGGDFLNPDADKLEALAKALNVPTSDVLTRAGYPVPVDHLSAATYFRTKYGSNLPDGAIESLTRGVEDHLARLGIDPSDTPADGEDEQPEPTPKKKSSPRTKKGGKT